MRVALIRLEATERDRPVTLQRLAQEVSDMTPSEILAALDQLVATGTARLRDGGWLSRPPAPAADATSALARGASLHR